MNGIAKLEKALEIIEKEIIAKNGTFKVVNKPQVIGAKDDKDIIEIMDKMHDEDEDHSGVEDNDEGMGDLDLGEDDNEERKENKKKHDDDDDLGGDDSDNWWKW